MAVAPRQRELHTAEERDRVSVAGLRGRCGRGAVLVGQLSEAGNAGRFPVRLAEGGLLGTDVGSALHAAVFQCDERGRAPAAEPGVCLRRVAQQLDAAGRMDALAGRFGADPGRPGDGTHRQILGHGRGRAPLMVGRTADALAAGTGPVEHAARQYATVRLTPDVHEDSQARLAVLPADGELPLPRRGQGLSRETGGGRRLEKVVKERFTLSFRVERSGIEKSHYAQKRHAGNKRKTLGRCLDCAALRST